MIDSSGNSGYTNTMLVINYNNISFKAFVTQGFCEYNKRRRYREDKQVV